MRIEIAARGLKITDATRDQVALHLRFALGRYSGRVKRVRVRLADENEPKGGLDKTCSITVRIVGLPAVIVKQASAELQTAVAIAAERASRTVARRLAVQG